MLTYEITLQIKVVLKQEMQVLFEIHICVKSEIKNDRLLILFNYMLTEAFLINQFIMITCHVHSIIIYSVTQVFYDDISVM